MTDPERQEPASPASASNEELREKVAEALSEALLDLRCTSDAALGNTDRLADAAIAAGAGTGHQELLDAAQAVLDAPRGYQRSDAMDSLGAAVAAMRGDDV